MIERMNTREESDTAARRGRLLRLPQQIGSLQVASRTTGTVTRTEETRVLTSPVSVTRSLSVERRLPERFGRYILLERMGQGGMAEVFKALVSGAEGFRRHVVVKRILSEKSGSPRFVEMFAQEARISAMLHHPNIVQVFDFGQVCGSYFLAMELLDGWDVRSLLRALRWTGTKMPLGVAVHIAHEVALGLSYAHTLKVRGHQPHIVHRDVSPSNIMCLRGGATKLLDFGVASVSAGPGSTSIEPRSFCGKLAYAAPEYVSGQAQDARIDLFAVGAVLWEMLVGERLFRGRSERETLDAVLHSAILPPSARRPAVPAEVDAIVMKALERDPDKRYQTAAAMADDLEAALAERHYQTKTLPRLLAHLWGEEPETAIETGVEELIQSGDAVPPPVLPPSPIAPPRASPIAPAPFASRLRARSTRLAGAAIALCLLAALGIGRSMRGAPTIAPPAPPAEAPIARPPGAPMTMRSAPPRTFDRDPRLAAGDERARLAITLQRPSPPASVAKVLAPPARNRATVRRRRAPAPGAFTSGLPIDPFEEAAARASRR
jgi:serine/threonine protein kinase